MGIKPVKRKLWIKFLKSMGLVEIKGGGKGGHCKWNRERNPLDWPIIFRNSDREIPRLPIDNALEVLGMTREEFEKRLKEL